MAKSPGMTRHELEEAQFLLRTVERAQELAERRDPNRQHTDRIGNHFDTISRAAHEAFFLVVGRPSYKVHSSELNTVSPAPWTRLPYAERAAWKRP